MGVAAIKTLGHALAPRQDDAAQIVAVHPIVEFGVGTQQRDLEQLGAGLPVSLGILYLFAARAQGWSATGLNFPGHFLIRLESSDGQRVIIDPFYNGRSLEIQSLRELLKVVRGAAETFTSQMDWIAAGD